MRLGGEPALLSRESSSEDEAPPTARCGRRIPAISIAGVAACALGFAALRHGRGAGAAVHGAPRVMGASLRAAAPGTVDAVYTFGAPASATPGLEDLATPDRCFPGLRAYTEDVLGPKTKQVDAAAIANSHEHARMAVASLRAGGDSLYVPCPGEADWPSNKAGDEFMEWRLHWEGDYLPRLRAITVEGAPRNASEPFKSSLQFGLFAYKAYDSTAHILSELPQRRPSWRLVARETLIQGTGLTYDEDPVMLLQDSGSLDCAFVFAGTNNLDNEVTTSLETFGAGYCGFSGVHDGYRNEMWSIAKELMPKLRPKLAKCNKVNCVGHSMGGSLCEIFAACANSGRTEDPDFRQQMWTKAHPELMPEIANGGIVYTQGAERRCDEPPCPKTTR